MQKRDFFEARILVVDDEADKVRLVSELLWFKGYKNIESVTDSSKAAGCFTAYCPDLVILDLHMAPLDGFAVLSRLELLVKSDDFLPVLMLTGDITREVKEKALAAGAMDFLVKPFNATELLLRVKNLLHTRLLYLELEQQRDQLDLRVQERTAEVIQTQNEMLERLAQVAEYRDDATGEHTRRVAKMTESIALTMGFPDADADLIGKAALLHDLGKVAMSDKILLKPGRFSEEEFSEMKKHVKYGGDLLKGSQSNLLQKAELIARFHHERWDGSGYQGLAGQQIPMEARITAVADVYDALTSCRPYKQAWTHEAAVAEIVRLSGSHFDPGVVEAFLKTYAILLTSESVAA